MKSRKAAIIHDALAFWQDHSKHYTNLGNRELLQAAASEYERPLIDKRLHPHIEKLTALRRELAAIYLDLANEYHLYSQSVAGLVEGDQTLEKLAGLVEAAKNSKDLE